MAHAPAAGGSATPAPVDGARVDLRLPAVEGSVFRVRLRAEGPPAASWTEWIAPSSGHCRRETERIELTTATHRVIIDPPSWGPSAGIGVRAGSERFVHGRNTMRCATFALGAEPSGEARIPVPNGEVVATVEERISADEADARGLFTFNATQIRNYDLELPLGEAPHRFRAYWLGRRAVGRVAVRAIEHFDRYRPNAPTRAYTVVYELPSDADDGGWSTPGSGPQPPDELQVGSQPAGQELAQRTVGHVRRWPRTGVRLANGEHASLYPNLSEGRPATSFTVVTRATVIGVAAGRGLRDREMRAIARRLRPVPNDRR